MLTTVEQALGWVHQHFDSAELFYGHGTDNPWDEACFLVLTVAELPVDADESVLSHPLTEAQSQRIQSITEHRIATRKPLPYLLNAAWFAGMKFYVDERVLVPRSPLAEVIANQCQPWCQPEKVTRILDLCTGSSCIAIALAKAFPQAQVDATDLSADALAVAEKNRHLHGMQDQLTLYQADVFEGLPQQHYDLIVSNPPYVDAEDFAAMPAEYQQEPEMGLASGKEGLDVTRCILAQAKSYLSAQGVLIVEVGNSWPALEAVYPQLPFTWLEFAHGGDGVFLLTREVL